MTYVRKNKEVNAIRLNADVFDKEGKVVGLRGDWLITEGENQYFMSDTLFHSEFELKPPETPQYVPWPIPYEPCRPVSPWYETCTSDKITFNNPLKEGTETPIGYKSYLGDVNSLGEVHLAEVGPGEFTWTDRMQIYTSDIDNVDLKVSFSVV
jgi:hypothetical protein